MSYYLKGDLLSHFIVESLRLGEKQSWRPKNCIYPDLLKTYIIYQKNPILSSLSSLRIILACVSKVKIK